MWFLNGRQLLENSRLPCRVYAAVHVIIPDARPKGQKTVEIVSSLSCIPTLHKACSGVPLSGDNANLHNEFHFEIDVCVTPEGV